MRRLAGALALALIALGCATPAPPPPPSPAAPVATRDDLYVLVPDADGKTGALSVTRDGDQRVLATPYASARILRQEGPIEAGTIPEELAKQIFGDAIAAQPARPVSFLLYFLEGKDELTPESQQAIQQVFAEIARRPSPEIVVIGHTDRVGTPASNDALSLRRAQRVRDDFVKRGIPAERIEVAGRGEREPLVPTAPQVQEPRNRRVEISIR